MENATVSVTSMFFVQKAKRVFEHAEKAFSGNIFDEAEKELDSALVIDPNSALAWCFLGTLHEAQRQLDKALWDYSQALVADSHLLAAYVGLARIAVQEQRWPEVIQLTDQIVKVSFGTFPVAYFYKAAANFNLRNVVAAEKDAREFESLDTKHERPQEYLLLGDILAREHDYAGAAEQKRTFLTLVPEADDAQEIKKQIEVLEDLNRHSDDATVRSGQNPKLSNSGNEHSVAPY